MISKTQPLVTIAIPTYNRADDYLKQAIESALNQTYRNIEIIVSDNCSPDNTEVIVKGYADSRIRYFRQAQSLKPNDNFNFCLKQAKGDCFLLLHDDDLIDNDFIEVCVKAANYSTDVGIIRTGIRRIDAHGKVLGGRDNLAGGLSTEDFFLAFLSRKISMLLCCTLFNTRKLKEIGGFHSKYQRWQDVYAEFQLAANFGRLDVQDKKASFRKHPSQTTFNVNIREWAGDAVFLLNAMCDLVPGKKTLIMNAGMQYFARHSYEIASNIRSPINRFIAYLIVFKEFKYRHLPPPIYAILSYTPLPYLLKFIRKYS